MRRSSGFTLVELMIAVLVAAVLTMIALTSYQDSIRKTRRSNAKVLLTTTAQLMERYFTENGRYNAAGTTDCGIDLPLPATVGTEDYYQVEAGATGCTADTPTTFTLTATPKNAQAKDTGCGNFTLDEKGAKGVSGALGVASCW